MDMDLGPLTGDLGGSATYAALAILALIDSTSFGTLLIPVWLLMAPGRVRAGRILVYLGAIGGFYALLGVGILLGGSALAETFAGLRDSRPFLWGQLLLGVGLFAWSFKLDPPKRSVKTPVTVGTAAAPDAPQTPETPESPAEPQLPHRLLRWRERAVASESGSTAALAGLAVLAGLVEVASMLPYLAAIGVIGTQGPGWPVSGLWIAAYCAVMIAPALLLTVLRVLAAPLVARPLAALDRWLVKHAASATAWAVGIVGFLLARAAAGSLFG
ncbi:Sap-like sulfolipid-1-addressing protein [Nocardioides albertanoniae]|uniref:Sap-like sulfolipid-1-addressing protein n=1 Tax=Nocardioides albertanoniae TaxID=1175486 RepID=A0A543A5B5_9ACTN|nr:GAP family protein [Nocardioides albertanoniae]TQL67793.1 Sap-like sulfolipid-1-addressing protein [Nocardioides albertanoniae]